MKNEFLRQVAVPALIMLAVWAFVMYIAIARL